MGERRAAARSMGNKRQRAARGRQLQRSFTASLVLPSSLCCPLPQAIAAKQAQAEREAAAAAAAEAAGEAAPRAAPPGAYEPPEWAGVPEGCACSLSPLMLLLLLPPDIRPHAEAAPLRRRLRTASPRSLCTTPRRLAPPAQLATRQPPLPPSCGPGLRYCLPACSIPYYLEVMKEGAIVDSIPLDSTRKDHYTFGRAPTCDIALDHPSSSR